MAANDITDETIARAAERLALLRLVKGLRTSVKEYDATYTRRRANLLADLATAEAQLVALPAVQS